MVLLQTSVSLPSSSPFCSPQSSPPPLFFLVFSSSSSSLGVMNFALGFRPPSSGSSGPGAGRRVTMENLEKQLICPVCLEMFSKPVVILPCQHNLCRKCASDIFQSANPPLSRGSSALAVSGSRFRCPSCRHEMVLDRHGVYGLQRNLLVENIIDLYRQQESSRLLDLKPEQQQQQLVCEDHDEEKINIYCLSCQTPTCSMCKVFGKHKDCDVAPLGSVYMRKKTELSNGIAALVASNDHIQEVISGMEEMCRTTEENGRRQRELLAGRFDGLVAILEEKKQELVGHISKEQDHKLKLVRRLIRRHNDDLEAAVTLVESAIQTMEETHMSLFVESADVLLEKMAATARASTLERPELGYETMNHFTVDTDDVAVMLMNIDFCSGFAADAEEEADDGGDESEL